MIFITHWRIPASNRDAAIARFAKTGGQPPQGIKLLARWHVVADGTGFSVSEASDSSAMARWALEWNDLMEMTTSPAMTDAELAGVLSEMSKR